MGSTFVNQHYKDNIVSGIITVKHTLTLRDSKEATQPHVPTFPSSHIYNGEHAMNIFMVTIQLVCNRCDIGTSHVLVRTARQRHSYRKMITLICHSFIPPDRHSILICIQHLRLRIFNAAIKVISDIKCICD